MSLQGILSSTWGTLVLGGAISGLVGVMVFEYRSFRQRRQKEREWYSSLGAQADKILTIDEEMDDEKIASKLWYLSHEIPESLERQAFNTPAEVYPNSEIIKDIQKLSSLCRELRTVYNDADRAGKASSTVKKDFFDKMIPISERLKKASEEAVSSKSIVSFNLFAKLNERF